MRCMPDHRPERPAALRGRPAPTTACASAATATRKASAHSRARSTPSVRASAASTIGCAIGSAAGIGQPCTMDAECVDGAGCGPDGLCANRCDTGCEPSETCTDGFCTPDGLRLGEPCSGQRRVRQPDLRRNLHRAVHRDPACAPKTSTVDRPEPRAAVSPAPRRPVAVEGAPRAEPAAASRWFCWRCCSYAVVAETKIPPLGGRTTIYVGAAETRLSMSTPRLRLPQFRNSS